MDLSETLLQYIYPLIVGLNIWFVFEYLLNVYFKIRRYNKNYSIKVDSESLEDQKETLLVLRGQNNHYKNIIYLFVTVLVFSGVWVSYREIQIVDNSEGLTELVRKMVMTPEISLSIIICLNLPIIVFAVHPISAKIDHQLQQILLFEERQERESNLEMVKMMIEIKILLASNGRNMSSEDNRSDNEKDEDKY